MLDAKEDALGIGTGMTGMPAEAELMALDARDEARLTALEPAEEAELTALDAAEEGRLLNDEAADEAPLIPLCNRIQLV